MVNYSNSKIYKIVDNTNGNIYIGSTCKKLCQRLGQHRQDYKRYLDGKYNYVSSFKVLENENFEIILIENCENITNREELNARERHYIESLNCVNMFIPNRTQKEWIEINKDKILQNKKEYYIKNKVIITEKSKTKIHCDVCNCEVLKCNIAIHKRTSKHQNNMGNN